MKASDYIAKFLKDKDIDCVFELAGGMITHILDSIHNIKGIEIITMHHEQSASFAADAYSRVKNIPGVALATSGPGATNLLTGIASCYFDSTPAIFITGQVNTHEQKGTKKIRQLGFQETDILSMAKPITKACFNVTNAQNLPDILEEAYKISTTGRPGPVLIDIPMDKQREDITVHNNTEPPSFNSEPINKISSVVLNELGTYIIEAKKPLILAGRGIRASGSYELFKKFIKITNIPVVTSLLGLDTLPYKHPLRAGFLGAYGNRWTNIAVGESDLIIVLGSRLDIRQTGADVDFFESNRTIVHVDCEEAEINNRLRKSIGLHADLKQFFSSFLQEYSTKPFALKTSWIEEINQLKLDNSDIRESINIEGINPNIFMHSLSTHSKHASAFIADVGNHQMWAAQSLELEQDQLFITSGGMGAMGYALPAAIGTYFANKQPNVMIAGDGGIQLNIQELQTIYRNKLPIKLVVINNKNLGMIRQFQDSYFESRYQSTFWGYSPPDFEKVAKAYGIESDTLSEEEDIATALEKMWENPNAPYLLQVMIDSHANAYPKIAFGRPLTQMEPFCKPLEMEGT